MAGCVSCFIIPLVLFLFHRFLQPLILKFWNPWETKPVAEKPEWNGWACPMKKKPVKDGKEEIRDNVASETVEGPVEKKENGENECCKLKAN